MSVSNAAVMAADVLAASLAASAARATLDAWSAERAVRRVAVAPLAAKTSPKPPLPVLRREDAWESGNGGPSVAVSSAPTPALPLSRLSSARSPRTPVFRPLSREFFPLPFADGLSTSEGGSHGPGASVGTVPLAPPGTPTGSAMDSYKFGGHSQYRVPESEADDGGGSNRLPSPPSARRVVLRYPGMSVGGPLSPSRIATAAGRSVIANTGT